ncbi:probable serine/threonine-protein kinase DDB_G0268876 [Palaemon carinicauda]|uniref:probable serine/threonine-protein kinase DDB_G0268876 n=1 Tax=Palaemon carinicauda TaxID=392227 RepID=UPI0035B6A916
MTLNDWCSMAQSTKENCKKALGIFKNVAKILHEIHMKGYGHNDLHMNNIILDEHLNPSVVDFGYTLKFGTQLFRNRVDLNLALQYHYDPSLTVYLEPTCQANDIYSFARHIFNCLILKFGEWISYDLDDLVNMALSHKKTERPSLLNFYYCLEKLESNMKC